MVGRAQCGDDGVEVRQVPVRQAAVVQYHPEQVLLEFALLVNLDGRHEEAFLVDLPCIGGQRPRNLASDVGHVAEHGRPGNQPSIAVDWHEHEPIIGVTDRAIDRVRVVREKDVAFLDGAVIALHETPNERAELADHHLALDVGDHRKFVVLLADAGRHRGTEQHRIHFEARISERAFNDVDRDGVDGGLAVRRVIALDDAGGHGFSFVQLEGDLSYRRSPRWPSG